MSKEVEIYGITSMILPVKEYNRLREIEEKYNKIVEYAKQIEGENVQ